MRRLPLSRLLLVAVAMVGASITACRKDPVIPPSTTVEIPMPAPGPTRFNMYVMNEGLFGQNNARLDYLDASETPWKYIANWYGEKNPTITKGLGDVANAIAIWQDRVYVVLNGSHKVEVLEAQTGLYIGNLEVPSPRQIAFKEGFVYVSSYASAAFGGPRVLGNVHAFDLASLKEVDRLEVGAQPEGVAVVGDRLYVANSGGYKAGGAYDKTVTVATLGPDGKMKKVEDVEVGINLGMMHADARGDLWVLSQGDYGANPSSLFHLSAGSDGKLAVKEHIEKSTGGFCISADTLFAYGSEYGASATPTVSFYALDTRTGAILPGDRVVTPEVTVKVPYMIAVHPTLRYRFVGDAGDFVSNGDLRCFAPDGKELWTEKAGPLPKGMAFVPIQ